MTNKTGHTKTCRRCKEALHQEATLCPHCGSEQKLKFATILKNAVGLIGVFVSIAMVVVAMYQLRLASQEKADATAAVNEVRKLEKLTAERAKEIRHYQSVLLSGEDTTYFVFLRGQENQLLPLDQALSRIGSDHGGAYNQAFWLGTYIQKEDNPSIQELRQTPDTYYFKFFEVVFLSWLHERYRYHWVRDDESMFRFGFSHSGGASFPTSSYPELFIWTKKDIAQAFSDNALYDHVSSSPQIGEIALPPETLVSVTSLKKKLERCITFENPQVKMTITIFHWDGYQVDDLYKRAFRFEQNFGQGVPCYAQIVEVAFSYDFLAEESLSELSAKQHKWIKGLIQQFKQDFSWWLVEKDLRSFPIAIDGNK